MTYILATAIILTLLYRRKWRLHERDEDMRVWVGSLAGLGWRWRSAKQNHS